MSVPTKRCCHCRHTFKPLRNPKQRYCSHSKCQSARKQKWRRSKKKTDPSYAINQSTSHQQWAVNHPGYWRAYRSKRPEYVERNRNQTRHRKKMAKSLVKIDAIEKFVKSDALPAKSNIQSGTYCLFPVRNNGFAKSDALIVKISNISCDYESFSGNCQGLQRDHLIDQFEQG